MAAKRTSRSPLPMAVRVSEENWGSSGEMAGFEMSTMMRSDGTATRRRRFSDQEDTANRRRERRRRRRRRYDGGISDQEATRGERSSRKIKRSLDTEESDAPVTSSRPVILEKDVKESKWRRSTTTRADWIHEDLDWTGITMEAQRRSDASWNASSDN
uniref:BZIP domain-containing protein n=1 Tax=Caenorhabditis tropicalis TaxID=1561998 RepID=A0A1I7TI71_9PELO